MADTLAVKDDATGEDPVSTFAVPGAELATELSDEGGRAVVQLHGLTSSRSRDRLLDLDLGRGLSGTRLLRYDARGHGRSTGRAEPDDYQWGNLADDLLRLLDHVFPGERVHGVGPSMGAATLRHAAVREPDRFSGLTLLLPPTAWATRAAKGDDYRAAARVVEEQGLDVFLEAGRLAPVPPATEGLPETRPDVEVDLLPALFRGAASTDLPSPEAVATIPCRRPRPCSSCCRLPASRWRPPARTSSRGPRSSGRTWHVSRDAPSRRWGAGLGVVCRCARCAWSTRRPRAWVGASGSGSRS
jgi:3-oxoadipate enol-lactonase